MFLQNDDKFKLTALCCLLVVVKTECSSLVKMLELVLWLG